MQSSSTERGGAQAPPGMLGLCWVLESRWRRGGCAEAGGEMSTGGWQGSSDAVAKSSLCSSAAGSSHSPAQKWFAEIQPLFERPWLPSQPLTAQGLLEDGDTQGCCSLLEQAERLGEQRRTLSSHGGLGPLAFLSLQTSSVHASVLPLLFPKQMEVAKPASNLDKKLAHIPPSP